MLNANQHNCLPLNIKNCTFAYECAELNKRFNIFFLVFYSLGTFCLPKGDFSVLQDIPEMYRQCKETEDKDMGPFDFITDHLLNIDGIFDKHKNGDDQKPHKQKQIDHQVQPLTYFKTYFAFSLALAIPVSVNPGIIYYKFLPSDFIFNIFRPPIT